MLTITINDQSLAQVQTSLAALYGRLQDFTPAMENIGQELESRVRGRFETQSDPLGHAWAPWAESTRKSYPYPGTAAAKKSGKAGNARVLDRYGDMIASLNWQTDPTSVRIGFGAPYATYHEYGTKRMPRRGLLFADPEAQTLAPDDQRYVLDAIQAFLLNP